MYSLNYQKPNLNDIVIDLPTSKSISNRALILNALLGNKIELLNLSTADDTQLMLEALSTSHEEINLQNAGTCMRFLTAYFSCISNQTIQLFCSDRMKQRPIKDLVEALQSLGAKIEYLEKQDAPPLKINGTKLYGKALTIDASTSSQFITAIMLIAPFIENGITLNFKGKIASYDYIKMTALLMKQFGFDLLLTESKVEIKEGVNNTILEVYNIEKDWSSAGFWYLIASLNPTLSICLKGLSKTSIQGDRFTVEIFEKLGIISTEIEDALVIKKTNHVINQLAFDLNNCIDLAPALSVACATLNINAVISGLQNLVIKESNRLNAIVTELNKFGYKAFYSQDTIVITSVNEIDFNKNITINSFNDHRIAMAFSPLASLFTHLKIDNIEVVSKSYPSFFNDLKNIGIYVK